VLERPADIATLADRAEKDHHWSEASALFLVLAHYHKDQREFQAAADYFMRSATAAERCEDWRRIGTLWVQCASASGNRAGTAVADVFDALEVSKHYFPTLDIYAWSSFSQEEKVGRAYRNAAYHLERAGPNQTAYLQYQLAGDAFGRAQLWDEASRSYYHAMRTFIARHGETDDGILRALERSNRYLVERDEVQFLRRCQLYYRGLASALVAARNYRAADELACKECESSRRLAWVSHRWGKWVRYSLWKYTADYGNSFSRWSFWVVVLFGLLFPWLFARPGVLVWDAATGSPGWLDYLYFSVATLTTAPDATFRLTQMGKAVAIVEGAAGFLMLGSLVTLLSRRLVQ